MPFWGAGHRGRRCAQRAACSWELETKAANLKLLETDNEHLRAVCDDARDFLTFLYPEIPRFEPRGGGFERAT